MEWSTIATIVLGSSFLGAALTNVVGWLIKRTEKARHSNFVALKLAYVFEGFAYTCLSAIDDHNRAEASDGHAGKYLTSIPPFPDLPELDYQEFDVSILDMVFDFPQHVEFGNVVVSSAFDVLDGEDAMKEARKSSTKLAINALSIADRVRKRYKLATRSLRFGDYSVRERLLQSYQGYTEGRA